jgi:fructose/tagatose bisphosphate aldolase
VVGGQGFAGSYGIDSQVMLDNIVIVHTIEQTKSALKEATESGANIVLQSAPDAIFYAGSLYLLNMFRHAQEDYPQAKAIFILDCGDARAETIIAMQNGHKNIKSSALYEIRAKLKAIATEYGVNLIEII